MNIYSGNYKRMLIVPIIFFFVLGYIAFVNPGLQGGLELKGGTLVIVHADKQMDATKITNALESKYFLSDLIVSSTGNTVRIQFADYPVLAKAKAEIDAAEAAQSDASIIGHSKAAVQILAQLVQVQQNFDNAKDALATAKDAFSKAKEAFSNSLQQDIIETYSLDSKTTAIQFKEVGASLGKRFWEQALTVTIAAIILITLVVFAFFREVIPSLAIISCAVFDILAGMASMAFLGIPVSLSSIASLLMLIGYSIDTDILLTTRVLKKKEGTARERAADSMVTGITMTSTALGAIVVMLLISFFNQMTVIFDIAIVLLGGLLGDLVGTWLWNAPILLWYAEWKEKKKLVK